MKTKIILFIGLAIFMVGITFAANTNRPSIRPHYSNNIYAGQMASTVSPLFIRTAMNLAAIPTNTPVSAVRSIYITIRTNGQARATVVLAP